MLRPPHSWPVWWGGRSILEAEGLVRAGRILPGTIAAPISPGPSPPRAAGTAGWLELSDQPVVAVVRADATAAAPVEAGDSLSDHVLVVMTGDGVSSGQPRAVVLDGATTWFWWGRRADDSGDAVAVDASRRVLTWPSRQDASAAGAAHAWKVSDEAAGTTTDLGPAQAWVCGRVLRLPTASVLGLWGWAGDVATSARVPWFDRGEERDRINRKLFAAEVPSFFDLEDYRPPWTAHELDVLRAVVAAGVRVLRAATHRHDVDAATLLAALPDLGVSTTSVVGALDAERAGR